MAADFDPARLLIHLDRAEEEQLLEPATIAAFRELVEAERDRRRLMADLAKRMERVTLDRINLEIARVAIQPGITTGEFIDAARRSTRVR